MSRALVHEPFADADRSRTTGRLPGPVRGMRVGLDVLAGLALTLCAGATAQAGAALDLDVQRAVLAGVSVGAVVALVPDRGLWTRLTGFGLGLLTAWAGYVVRVLVLPDTDGGRTAAVVVPLLGCVAILAVSRHRLALWSLLLGAGTFAAAYEQTYASAPAELLRSSTDVATILLLTSAVGVLAACLIGAHDRVARR